MIERNSAWSGLAALLLVTMVVNRSRGDEGMWLFNSPPREHLKEKYKFDPTDDWLNHLQKSSVRFNSGGSGSFVSSKGLVMTNHHVGADSLQKMSKPGQDLLIDGFYAKSAAEELKCVDLELNVLESIEDVTKQVAAVVKPGMSPADAEKARRAVMADIEKQSLDKTGLRSDVITLYQGGLYHLYRFKRYTDVRLVFAPEKRIAFFGGDPDNFEFPRYDLDVCFFRAYENDKPAEIKDFLKWSANGAADNELVFVSGHPGRTNRLNTVEHLEFFRDFSYPFMLNYLRRLEIMLRIYSDRSAEHARRAQDELFGVQNSRKARLGGLAGLQDPAVMAAKKSAEGALRAAVAKNPEWKKEFGGGWEQIDETLAIWREVFLDYFLLEQGTAFNSDLFRIARTLVRLADEDAKPSGERLREFRESNRESLELELFSDAPIYADLETVKLADSLSMLMEQLGANNPTVQKVLAGKSPSERAAELVQGTKLADVKLRKQLAAGKAPAINAATDAMIQLAREIDGPARKVRATFEEKVEEVQRQAYAKIAGAQFATEGTNQYPDATFTLRLAFGEVKGYRQAGQDVPPWTTMGGTYVHAEDHGFLDPYALPVRWLERKGKIDLDTPFNFICTADIIGGNSGSPVVNRAGELVGIIFDGNIQSLVLAFAYTDEQARAVSVHSSAIREALDKVYEAKSLVAELGK